MPLRSVAEEKWGTSILYSVMTLRNLKVFELILSWYTY